MSEADERMKKALGVHPPRAGGIRSGKATPALLDTVRVEAYGQQVPIQQVGSVNAPESRLLVVQPWDKSLIKAIVRGIQQADLGLNPLDDGTVVRVPLPTLTEERRKDLVQAGGQAGWRGPRPHPAGAPRGDQGHPRPAEEARDVRGRGQAPRGRSPEAHGPIHRADRRAAQKKTAEVMEV